jgi:hypothetical protein
MKIRTRRVLDVTAIVAIALVAWLALGLLFNAM